ncbi:MAG: RagB/SusD family nutrient uptake outer membrane protein [Tannerellaceae bacterium]|nr:RagB/SusD family nutrient uptake outer membrane protein [Tannerellaceae bacterium]
MKKNLFKSIYLVAVAAVFSSCSDSWLDPEPLSFYEPSITLSTKEGLEAALTTCQRQLRYYYMHDNGPALSTELFFSDVVVSAISDLSGSQDLISHVTPTSNNDWFGSNMIEWFWRTGTHGNSFANVVITRIPELDIDDATKEQMLSRAYFQRAWRNYHLIFQFGDIPFLSKEVSTPKLDFRSVKMEVVIEQTIKDLEYAVAHIADRDDYGKENKGSCLMLLIKFYMAAGQFNKAVEAANTLINNSGFELMEIPFGTFENPFPDVHPIAPNVIWDLHRPVNKSIAANKETIMVMINRYDNSESRLNTNMLFNLTPFWSQTDKTRGILTPGKAESGLARQAGTPEMLRQHPDYIDQRAVFGGGEAFSRHTYFVEKGVWDDPDDLRHSRATGNWFVMEDLVYNDPALLGTNDAHYYQQPIQKYAADGTLLCTDTIRCWFDFPYYKLWVEDIDREVSTGYSGVNYVGGPGDWYLYRLAEAYLLRAEAYYWLNEPAKAAEDVNRIRKRAGCTKFFNAVQLTGLDGLDVIMDERARELTYEELRHVELVRVSFIKANQEGIYNSPKDLADESSNSYWWHRITKYNNYYNKGVKTLHGDEYRIGKHNIFWPITQRNIDANLYGRINQNYGYAGYEKNETPISSLEELEASGQ